MQLTVISQGPRYKLVVEPTTTHWVDDTERDNQVPWLR